MNNGKMSVKMRNIAGVLYGILCLYQAFTMEYALMGAPIVNLPMAVLLEFALLLGAGAFAVWLLAGRRQPVGDTVRRAVLVATVLLVAFELLTNTVQRDLMELTLMTVFTSLQMTGVAPIWPFVLYVVRLLLLILAAFFVQSASADLDKAVASEAAEQSSADEADEEDDSDDDFFEEADKSLFDENEPIVKAVVVEEIEIELDEAADDDKD